MNSSTLNELRSNLVRVLLAITRNRQGLGAEISPASIKNVLDYIDSPKPGDPLVEAFKTSIREMLPEVLSNAPTVSNPILPGLPAEQAQILGELLKTPEYEIKSAQIILGQLSGVRLTEGLCRSLANILRRQGWAFRCPAENCGLAATITWGINKKYLHGGRGQFAHGNNVGKTVLHSSITTLHNNLVIVSRAR